jgi:hypothetical protein
MDSYYLYPVSEQARNEGVNVKQTRNDFFMRILAAAIIAAACSGIVYGQIIVDTSTPTVDGDNAAFWAKIPAGYSADHPPAILVFWHGLGGSQYEMQGFAFDEAANARGWIAACHNGTGDRHWNTERTQHHCRAMLDWIMANYPFSRDSIYMIGGSMGGAAGQIWHNNNCGPDDYLLAANVGASQILDCQLRQEQYLAAEDTNRSMRAAFGGLPSERDSVAWAYHRASGICISDSTESMHFNSLHLPVWNTWGNSVVEDTAYGRVSLFWDSSRSADHADTTRIGMTNIDGHGMVLMDADSVCNWLSGFSANRYPDDLFINADENDSYYWTDVQLMENDTVFGRYGVKKDSALRRIEVNYIRNVASITVNFVFPWPAFEDSLICVMNINDSPLETTTLILDSIAAPDTILRVSGVDVMTTFEDGRLTVRAGGSSEFIIYFRDLPAAETPIAIPAKLRIVGAYPNPFNSTVALEIESPRAIGTEVLFYDILGRRVLTKPVALNIGTQRILVPADGLTSGSYYVRLQGDQHTQRVVLIR